MPNFNEFITRHGEIGVQAIVEHIERREGIKYAAAISLEDRWDALARRPEFFVLLQLEVKVMQMQHEDTVTLLDLSNIHTLVECLSAEKGFHRENCYFLLEQEFGITHINQLKRSQLELAVALLVNLQCLTVH